jgi:flagellin
VNVLAKDGKMSIQVGANDGETIDIDLKKSTLLLWAWTALTLTVLKALQLHWLVRLTSNPTMVRPPTSLQQLLERKAPPDDLSTRLGLAAGGALVDPSNVYKDDNGNMFAKVTIKSTSAAETNNLKANGFDIANGASKDFFIAGSTVC